jgi:hypothetical protein
MEGTHILEGTWEEIKLHEVELAGRELRVIVKPVAPPSHPKSHTIASQKGAGRVSAMGKYAGVLSSEEFMRRKQEDIALEDRPRQ